MNQVRRWWRRTPWLGVVGEIAIVVAGILIAFTLDRWWERRGAEARERAHLHALTVDFEQNVQRLEHLIELEERVSRTSRELLLLARSGEEVPIDSVRGMMGMIFTSNRFEPVMGAYEELVSSAGLALLRDDSLRASLAAFSAQLDVRYFEHFSTEIYLTFIRDFIGELSYFAPSVAGDDDRAVARDRIRALLEDPGFQEHLALRYLAERDVAGEYRRLEEQARTILDRLAALADRNPTGARVREDTPTITPAPGGQGPA